MTGFLHVTKLKSGRHIYIFCKGKNRSGVRILQFTPVFRLFIEKKKVFRTEKQNFNSENRKQAKTIYNDQIRKY